MMQRWALTSLLAVFLVTFSAACSEEATSRDSGPGPAEAAPLIETARRYRETIALEVNPSATGVELLEVDPLEAARILRS